MTELDLVLNGEPVFAHVQARWAPSRILEPFSTASATLPPHLPAVLQGLLPIIKVAVLHGAVPAMNEGIMEKKFGDATKPFHVRLDERMTELRLSNAELASKLGYEKPNVIALIRIGQMRMPIQLVQPLAKALDLPTRELFETLMCESMPEVLATLKAIYDPLALTTPEVNLITHLRRGAKDQPYTPIVMSGKGIVALVTTNEDF